MKTCLALADARGTFLFAIRPDWFPEGYLTTTELLLWQKYYEDREKRMRPKEI